ncbi:hypothetical protein Cpir12675_002539 [Ceratocystis pirilliformis]|uniref:Uncharacterized protein n=1 Tax=Ceratocystis pirilliformis TaxID=259994 RepID=A0ABR3Z9E5_9PEZI
MSQQPIEFFSIRPDLSRPTTATGNSKLVIDRDSRKPLFGTYNAPSFAATDAEFSILGSSTPTKSPAQSVHGQRRQRPASIEGLRGRASAPQSPLQRSWSSANRRELGAITPEGVPIPRRRSSLASVTRHSQVISLTEAYRIALEEDEGAVATDLDGESEISYDDPDYYDEQDRREKNRAYDQEQHHREGYDQRERERDRRKSYRKDQRDTYDKPQDRFQRPLSPTAMDFSPSPAPRYSDARDNKNLGRSRNSLLLSSPSMENVGTIKARTFQDLKEKTRSKLTKSPSLTRGLRRSGSKSSMNSFVSDDGVKSPASKPSRLLKYVPGLSREPSSASLSQKNKDKEKDKEKDVAASPGLTPSKSKNFFKRLVKRGENKDSGEAVQATPEPKKAPEPLQSLRPPLSPVHDQRFCSVQATPPPSRPVTSLGHALTHSRSYSGRSPNSLYSWQVGDDITGVEVQVVDSPRARVSPGSAISTPRRARSTYEGETPKSARSSLGPRDDRTLRFSNNRLDEIRALEKAIEEVNGDGNEYLHHHVLTTTTTILRSPEHRLKDGDVLSVRSPDRRARDIESLSLRSPDRSRARDLESPSVRSRDRYVRSPDGGSLRDTESIKSPDRWRESERERRESRKSAPAGIMPLHELSEPEDETPATKLQEIRQREIEVQSRRNVASAKLEEIRELNSQPRTRSLSSYVNHRRRTAPALGDASHEKGGLASPVTSPRLERKFFETPPPKDSRSAAAVTPQSPVSFESIPPTPPAKDTPPEMGVVETIEPLRISTPEIRNKGHAPVTPDAVDSHQHHQHEDLILEEDEPRVENKDESGDGQMSMKAVQEDFTLPQECDEIKGQEPPNEPQPVPAPTGSAELQGDSDEDDVEGAIDEASGVRKASHSTIIAVETSKTRAKLVSANEEHTRSKPISGPLPTGDVVSAGLDRAEDVKDKGPEKAAEEVVEVVGEQENADANAVQAVSQASKNRPVSPSPISPYSPPTLPQSGNSVPTLSASEIVSASAPLPSPESLPVSQNGHPQPPLTLNTALAPIPGSPESLKDDSDPISAPVSAVLTRRDRDSSTSRSLDLQRGSNQQSLSAHSSVKSAVHPSVAHGPGVSLIRKGSSSSLLSSHTRKVSSASVSSDAKPQRNASVSSQADRRADRRASLSRIPRSASASTVHSVSSAQERPNSALAVITTIIASSASTAFELAPAVGIKHHGNDDVPLSSAPLLISTLPASSLSLFKRRNSSQSSSRRVSVVESASDVDVESESDVEMIRLGQFRAAKSRSTSRASVASRVSSRSVSNTTSATEKLHSRAISPPIIHQAAAAVKSPQMHSRTRSSPPRFEIKARSGVLSPTSPANSSPGLAPSPIPDLIPNLNLDLLHMHRRAVSTDSSSRARHLSRNTSGTELYRLNDPAVIRPTPASRGASRIRSKGANFASIQQQHVVSPTTSMDSPVLEPAIVDGTPIETPRPPPISKMDAFTTNGRTLGPYGADKGLSSKLSLSRLDVIAEGNNGKGHGRRTASMSVANSKSSSSREREQDCDDEQSTLARRTSAASASEIPRTRSRSQPFRRAPINSAKPPSVREDLRELKRQYGVEDSTIDIDDYTELMKAQQEEVEAEESQSRTQTQAKAISNRSSRRSSARSTRDSHSERNPEQELAACDKALQNLRSVKQGLSRLEHSVSGRSVSSRSHETTAAEAPRNDYLGNTSAVESDDDEEFETRLRQHGVEIKGQKRMKKRQEKFEEAEEKRVMIHQTVQLAKNPEPREDKSVDNAAAVPPLVVARARARSEAKDEPKDMSQNMGSTISHKTQCVLKQGDPVTLEPQNVVEAEAKPIVDVQAQSKNGDSPVGLTNEARVEPGPEPQSRKEEAFYSSFSSEGDDVATLISSTYTDGKMATSSMWAASHGDGDVSRSQAELRKRNKPVLIDVPSKPSSKPAFETRHRPPSPSIKLPDTAPPSPTTKYTGLNLRRRPSTASMDIVSVDIPVPRVYNKAPFRLTMVGILITLFALWYTLETVVCDRHCRPVTCSAPCVWQNDDPTFGYAIPVKVDQLVTGGKGRKMLNQAVQDADDCFADVLDWATGTDITKIDSTILNVEGRRQLRRRLRKKGLIKQRADTPEQLAKYAEWARALEEQDRQRADEAGYSARANI